MDLIAEKLLWDQTQQRRVRPTLNLLVECKRSDLPYVFFLSEQQVWTPRCPVIAGLACEEVNVSTDDDGSTWTYDVLKILGVDQHRFLRSDVPCATTFARCERQGSKLRLSGAEPYNSLVHPLVKALEHFRAIEAPPTTAVYFDLHFAMGLAVLDCPMVAVPADPAADRLMVPWVRIPRHRGMEGVRSYEHRRNVYGLDVVHVAFLDTYIEQHLLPFAGDLSTSALKHHVELADGQGFVAGMGKHWYDDIEARIVPRKLRDAAKRAAGVVKSASRQIRTRTKRQDGV